MKKQLVLLLLGLFLLPVLASARPASAPYANENIEMALNRAAASAFSREKVDWAQRLQAEERKINSAAGAFQASFYALTTKGFPQHPICTDGMDSKQCKQITKTFNTRKQLIQGLLQKNEVLKKYKLFVSVPADLYELTEDDISYLSGFLLQPVYKNYGDVYYTPHHILKPQNGVIEVELWNSNIQLMRLRMDARRKTVFLFRQ